jgi:hypothetical protein
LHVNIFVKLIILDKNISRQTLSQEHLSDVPAMQTIGEREVYKEMLG